MQISEIEVKNFRSIEHQSFVLDDYSLLIGPNNSGKSNVIDSILAFYEEYSFKESSDHPKFAADVCPNFWTSWPTKNG